MISFISKRSLIFFSLMLYITASVKPENQEKSLPQEISNTYSEWIQNIQKELAVIDDSLEAPSTDDICTIIEPSIRAQEEKKEWTFITYMSARNDLAPFARKNLRQQADIGSTHHINIVTQLDTFVAGNKKITKRYYVEKDRLVITNQHDPLTQEMDSGLPETLIDCCKWAIENFPAKHYVLVLWNHGTGALDIVPRRTINPWPLFLFNPKTNLLELDRSIPFIDFVQTAYNAYLRAICFDDSTGHYLSNQDLEMALEAICTKLLHGKKIDIICFDACLMAMIEIADIVKNYAQFMVASEEVELGSGYYYDKILQPFLTHSMDSRSFAHHIVNAYQSAYNPITNDYTQSALNLDYVNAIEKQIDTIAHLLIDALRVQHNNSVREAIKLSRHKLYCTHFDEPSYLDAQHFLANLLTNMKKCTFTDAAIGKRVTKELKEAIQQAIKIIQEMVVSYCAGKNLAQAHGLSIYFPERKIHPSYPKTKFAQSNTWLSFIKNYLA